MSLHDENTAIENLQLKMFKLKVQLHYKSTLKGLLAKFQVPLYTDDNAQVT